MRVAIDGPAGSGKSTVARAVAKRCGLTYLDTGAMYRSVTYLCLSRGVDVSDAEAVSAIARTVRIDFAEGQGTQRVIADGKDVTTQIRTPEVDKSVSRVSAVPAVREAMVARQRELGLAGDVVAEGRDIGTVVFPDAEVKVFLTADPAARAHRRAVQREGGNAATSDDAKADAATEREILKDLVRRDRLDSTRSESPLRPAEDAHHIDSSSKSVDPVVDEVVALMTTAIPVHPAAPAGEGGTAAEATQTTGRLRAFRKNSYDDYYDHALRDFPLPGRVLLGVAIVLVGAITKLLWPWKIEDAEKLWEDVRGRVIVMNHVSMLDPVIIAVSLWFHGVGLRIVYKSEFDKLGIVTWFFSRAGGIPVVRGTADLKAVRRAERALRRGECVLIYPEGTRVKSDDEPVEIHGGFALMAQLAKAPVQPVAIVGARDITPAGKHLKRLGRVWCKAGDCIGFDEVEAKGRKARAVAMEKLAMERVYALRDELRREHPGKM